MGAATARLFADEGAKVIIADIQESEGRALAAEIGAAAAFARLDITVEDDWIKAIAMARDQFGGVDVLVNNAGYGYRAAVEEGDDADVRTLFETHFFGTVAMIKAVLPGMRARRSGHIVNVTSMGGFITMPGISFYCGSKFALEGISEALGKEVAGFGIRVTTLAPG